VPEQTLISARSANEAALIVVFHELSPKVLELLETLAPLKAQGIDVFAIIQEGVEVGPIPQGSIREIRFTRSEVFLPEYPGKLAIRGIVPGNYDLLILAFWRRMPFYKHVWYAEYDVWFQGGVGDLARINSADSSDLLGGFFWSYEEKPRWPHWEWMVIGEIPETCRPIRLSDFQGGLLSLSRLSHRLLAVLDQAYRQGWGGHAEATIPTLCRLHGMSARQIDEASLALGLPPQYDWGTFNVGAARPHRGMSIYHPVKTEHRIQELLTDLERLSMQGKLHD
jgi:hypothetical protein